MTTVQSGPRVLVLGAGGMLGHKTVQVLSDRMECWATVRGAAAQYARFGMFDPARLIDGVDATSFETVMAAVARARPAVVVNCIGILKQLAAAKDPIATLQVNALFPQRLALLCDAAGAWLVHVSTDCVFSGRRGNYRETDPADAEDLYGRTKLLGEPGRPGTLVLRTSMIGRELQTRTGLAEWLISNRGGHVTGFRRARFSGLTTNALADLIGDLIEGGERPSGLYHVGSEFIDKHTLLCRLNDAFGLDITIGEDDATAVDRTLDSERFWAMVGRPRPAWDAMIAAMAADPTPYDTWRQR